MRDIIVGDVHGCFDELEALLEKANLDKKKDRLIFIGDLMDRGPKSFETLSFVKKMKETMEERCVYIRGNHEEMCLDHLKSKHDDEQWRHNGSLETIQDFYNHDNDINNHLDWIRDNTIYYFQTDSFQCVHAGLYKENPEENEIDTLIWDRLPVRFNCYNGKLTIVGHTPFETALYLKGNMEPMVHMLAADRYYKLPENGMICIDTGCVYGGMLSALVISELGCRVYSVRSGEKRE